MRALWLWMYEPEDLEGSRCARGRWGQMKSWAPMGEPCATAATVGGSRALRSQTAAPPLLPAPLLIVGRASPARLLHLLRGCGRRKREHL